MTISTLMLSCSYQAKLLSLMYDWVQLRKSMEAYMGGHIIQQWNEWSIDDQDHDRYDWVFRLVVENEDLYGWDYRLTENHERYYLNRVCILETQSLWSKERWVMSSEDLKDWKEEVSIGDPECQMQWLKLSILAVTIKENWNQVGIDQVECKEGLKVSWDDGHWWIYWRY